jgi:hypothetical protein
MLKPPLNLFRLYSSVLSFSCLLLIIRYGLPYLVPGSDLPLLIEAHVFQQIGTSVSEKHDHFFGGIFIGLLFSKNETVPCFCARCAMSHVRTCRDKPQQAPCRMIIPPLPVNRLLLAVDYMVNFVLAREQENSMVYQIDSFIMSYNIHSTTSTSERM